MLVLGRAFGPLCELSRLFPKDVIEERRKEKRESFLKATMTVWSLTTEAFHTLKRQLLDLRGLFAPLLLGAELLGLRIAVADAQLPHLCSGQRALPAAQATRNPADTSGHGQLYSGANRRHAPVYSPELDSSRKREIETRWVCLASCCRPPTLLGSRSAHSLGMPSMPIRHGQVSNSMAAR